MDPSNAALAAQLIPETYVRQGLQSHKQRSTVLKFLLSQRRMPEEGWDDSLIEYIIQQLAIMDSNNFAKPAGVGEREGRVLSSLVRQRHFGLAHGVGRSGDIAAVQPKAAGSSILYKLTNSLALEALRRAGMQRLAKALVLPVATGMAITLVLLSFKARRTESSRKYVIWSRIDQKACVKAVLAAGLDLIVIDTKLVEDELQTDVDNISKTIENIGAENVLCVITTTSCFAPRACDSVEAVSEICAHHNIFHTINNAYGVQSSAITHKINEAMRRGRVDAIVQSTDKNFCVPVGGSIVASMDPDCVAQISKTYPGRASSSPIVDLFITLLSLGSIGWDNLRKERKENFAYLHENLKHVADKYKLRVLKSPLNPISIAMTLPGHVCSSMTTEFGSMLYTRGVSGARVVAQGSSKNIGPHSFLNWGCNHDSYPSNYMTAACALGLSRSEIDRYIVRLDKSLASYIQRISR